MILLTYVLLAISLMIAHPYQDQHAQKVNVVTLLLLVDQTSLSNDSVIHSCMVASSWQYFGVFYWCYPYALCQHHPHQQMDLVFLSPSTPFAPYVYQCVDGWHQIGMTLLVIHIIVYAAFAYLAIRRTFEAIRNTGILKCCGCYPTDRVILPTKHTINHHNNNGHDSDGSGMGVALLPRSSTLLPSNQHVNGDIDDV
jgi:hypothetical protein